MPELRKDEVKSQLNPKLSNEQVIGYLDKEGLIPENLKTQLPTGTTYSSPKDFARFYSDIGKANEFINSLVNKVTKSLVLGSRWDNELSVFQKGILDVGETIELMYVGLGKRVGFNKFFDKDSGGKEISVEGNLFGKSTPKVYTDYISVNGMYKYRDTVSVERLSTAFLTPYGLVSFVNELINSQFRTAKKDNYMDSYNLLFAKEEMTEGESPNSTGEITGTYGKSLALRIFEASKQRSFEEGKRDMIVEVEPNNIKDLAEKVRAYTGKLTHIVGSEKYNISGAERNTDRSKMVFITDDETIAKLDVNVLADAFNVSKAEVPSRTITIAELPKGDGIGTDWYKNDIKGILVDEDVVQFWYKTIYADTMKNPDQMTINYFYHEWVINSLCLFCNAIIFTEKDK